MDFEKTYNKIKPFIIILFIILLVLYPYIRCQRIYEDKNTIKSTKPITPKIELVIENNKVDTIYVYSLNKKINID
jgi:hypothetical protein